MVGKGDLSLDHCATKCICTGCCSGLVLVGLLSIRLLLALTFQGYPDFPDAFLVNVLRVSCCGLGEGLEGLGFRDKAVDLLLNRDHELLVRCCADGICGFDFSCIGISAVCGRRG